MNTGINILIIIPNYKNRDNVYVPHDDLQQRLDEPLAGAVAVDRGHHQTGQQELPAGPSPRELHETEENDRRGGK